MSTSGDAAISPILLPAGTEEPYNLLSFDGGGVKGISSMMILKKVMNRVRDIENEISVAENKPVNPEERKPVDYFHLGAGTSTGGLIALMLFRLNMNCSQVIAQYNILAKQVFSPRIGPFSLYQLGRLGKLVGDLWIKFKMLTGQSQFSHKPLELAIDTVVGSFPLDDDDEDRKGDAMLVKGSQGQGQMFMCATLADKGESILLRNYDPPFAPLPVSAGAKDLNFNAITIKEAARATSAAPTYLKQVNIQGLNFWDGGLLNNNPIDQIWDNRYDLVARERQSPHIRCILSLGTTHPDYDPNKKPPGRFVARFFNTVSQTVAFVTNTEAKHRDFERNMRQRNRRRPDRPAGYFRFNATTEKEEFDLSDYLKMPKLCDYTDKYLKNPDVDRMIDECAALLAKRP